MESNLEKFLQCSTPMVPSRIISQNYISDPNITWEYFTIGDLTECYSEWSAFGLGIPVILNSGRTIMQYYFPSLSALHIYSYKSEATLSIRDDEFESESSSDESEMLSRSLSNNSSRGWDGVSEDSSVELESPWSVKDDKFEGHYLQFNEVEPPHYRPPLHLKVMELAQDQPALINVKSVDLFPASWMAVAWYPIYSIPSGINEKDLSTSFLTYHTLSSSFQDCAENISELTGEKPRVSEIPLRPFGLATYKMNGSLWVKKEASDMEKLSNLHSAAQSWLKQLNAYHHDFNFFSRSTMYMN